ncbi:MAG: hypothetical protein NXI21_19380, partial [Alphaproteobacteria bacterium]|nr:hypothetical protein [Alphaproteobacteria bacterium]
VGAVPDAPAPYSPSKPLRDALRPADESAAAPGAASETGAANRPDDLSRARRALKEAGEPAPADPGPAGLADGLKRFQARRGRTADGFARPGGPTDRALDNIRRRRRRLAEQGRPEAGETLDDRLAVFTEAERDRRAAAADDFAALMQSRTGRLHVLRLAGTALESVARPLVDRELHRLRAERTPLTREEDPPEEDEKPPQDDPPPDDPPEEDEEPPPEDPPTPSEQLCIELWAALRRAKEAVREAEERLEALWEEFFELNAQRDTVEAELKRKAAELGVGLIFRRLPSRGRSAVGGRAGRVLDSLRNTVSPVGDMLLEGAEILMLVYRYNSLGERARTLHDDKIIPLQNEELERLRILVGEADTARINAGCEYDPSRNT